MKHYKFIGLLTALLMLVTSCEKFLEEQPRNEIAYSNFFKSPEEAYSVVNSLYNKGVSSFYLTGINGAARIMYGGFKAGLFDNQYKMEFIVRAQRGNNDPSLDNTILFELWQGCYEAIVRNANFAIKNIPNTTGLSDVAKEQLLAEAKFFRALNYFYLVKMFGPVPLVTEPYETVSDIYVPRSAEKKIYGQIITDLVEALELHGLPNVPMTENGFRISNGSAIALLADVYLNMAGHPVNDKSAYPKALEAAKLLTSNTDYRLVENTDHDQNSAYAKMRRSDNEKEYLYVIEYDEIIKPGGGYPMFCFPQQATTWGEFPKYTMCNLGYDPVEMLHKVYNKESDLRYQERQYFHSSYTQVNGPNAGTVRRFEKPVPYFWWEEKAALETGISAKDRPHYRLAEVYLIAAEAAAAQHGVTDEAVGFLAQVQARASMTQSLDEIKARLSLLSTDAFIEEVWREKIRELMFENKIWNDITRTRMFPEAVGLGMGFTPLLGATNPFGGTYTEENIYLPISSLELQRNPTLTEPPL